MNFFQLLNFIFIFGFALCDQSALWFYFRTGHHDSFINAMVPLQEATIAFLRKMHGPAAFSLSPDALRAAFRKLFLLDKPTLFQIMDKWPVEHERV